MKPWQDEKWWNTNITRLKALKANSTPWNTREMLGAYIEALEKAGKSNDGIRPNTP